MRLGTRGSRRREPVADVPVRAERPTSQPSGTAVYRNLTSHSVAANDRVPDRERERRANVALPP